MKRLTFKRHKSGARFHRIGLTKSEIRALAEAITRMSAIWTELTADENGNLGLLRKTLLDGHHPQEPVLRYFIDNHECRFGPIRVRVGQRQSVLAMTQATDNGSSWKMRKLTGDAGARQAVRRDYAAYVFDQARAAMIEAKVKPATGPSLPERDEDRFLTVAEGRKLIQTMLLHFDPETLRALLADPVTESCPTIRLPN